MTKIDETKQYKFREIVRMLEDKELPVGTVLKDEYYHEAYVVEGSDWGLTFFEQKGYRNAPILCCCLINYLWTIKLPKEDKYYLKAPDRFAKGSSYLVYNTQTRAYFLDGIIADEAGYQTKFTQSEIDDMPFDTSFFGEPIEAEEEV